MNTFPETIDCLNVETVASFVEGLLDYKSRVRVVKHVASCMTCHALVPRLNGAGRTPSGLRRGMLVGTFLVIVTAAGLTTWIQQSVRGVAHGV